MDVNSGAEEQGRQRASDDLIRPTRVMATTPAADGVVAGAVECTGDESGEELETRAACTVPSRARRVAWCGEARGSNCAAAVGSGRPEKGQGMGCVGG
jgi:hypothetical protein